MGSSRLPGKVLLDIGGQPMLSRVVERTRRATTVDQVVVATTSEPEDEAVAVLCAELGYPCYRGSLHDVLDRYYQSACLFKADVIVRITADCPVIDPQVVDRAVRAFWGETQAIDQRLVKSDQRATTNDQPIANSQSLTANPYDFVANRLPPPWGRTYPIGLDTEVCSFTALKRTWEEAALPYHREHVMPYMYEHCDRFRVLLVNYPTDYGDMRWTVDVPEDLELVRRIFAYFDNRDAFSWLEIVDLFVRHPELTEINAQVRHKTYSEVDHRRDSRDT